MSGPEVVVTGLGLITPAGIGVEENWNRLCSGEATAKTDPALAALDVTFSCRVPDFDVAQLLGKTARRLDRFTQFALIAARQAVTDARLNVDQCDQTRVAVVMGCAVGGQPTLEHQHRRLLEQEPAAVSPLMFPMFLANMAAAQISMDLGVTGPNFVVNTACAAGATAIGQALELLRSGACDIAIAGGCEAAITPLTITAFAQMRALSRRNDDPSGASRPFDADRGGFVMSEGAAVLVLERRSDALARQAPLRASVLGFGATADAHHVTNPHPEGLGAEGAVRVALHEGGISPEQIDHINAHGTGTKLNDLAEGSMLRRVFPHGPSVTGSKGVTGHLLGAAGAVEAAITVLTIQNGSVPPTANLRQRDSQIQLDVVARAPRKQKVNLALSTSFGFGGQNAALVLGAA
ncbi:MAG: beta-ketoacyl-[acyl-carrier-protein] synthase family protein [Corynebacteriales bacterium]|nr:beta-ketoacyl-[acyl-carrier-protein] synthase family protein [Mycobacteriales bacterium]